MIKMRINKNENSKCRNCNVIWKCTSEMYDIMIGEITTTICRKCSQELFQKLLKADCLHNSKLKSNEDLKRIRNENAREMKKIL